MKPALYGMICRNLVKYPFLDHKIQKNLKKGVDKPKGVCYTVQAVSERHPLRESKSDSANLENDTENREKFSGNCEESAEVQER